MSLCYICNNNRNACRIYNASDYKGCRRYKDIADPSDPIIIPEEGGIVDGVEFMPRTLAQIDAEKRKIQRRIDINRSMDHRLFGITIILIGLGIGLSAIPAFILLPWMCGAALIVVSILGVWGGNASVTNENRLMKASQIADLEDKLIDLDAEYSDRIEHNFSKLGEPDVR